MMVKVCGITNLEDAFASAACGAGALGFNFWPGSPRYIEPSAAESIMAHLPSGVWKVGVFVEERPECIDAIARRLQLDVVQLHGDCGAPTAARVWRAVSVTPDFQPDQLDAAAAEAFLLDSPAGSQWGGTGRTFDWNLARGAGARVILAGGLGPGNVASAIDAVHPWGVDACSRLESAPGRKDHTLVAAFCKAALSRT